MKEKLCFILFVCCIICNAENNSRVFGEILKVDNSTYIEVDFPYNSTYNIDSSGINLSYGSFELYIHYSKHTKDSHDFFQVFPKELYNFTKNFMHSTIVNIIEFNRGDWRGFRADLLLKKTEKIALVYIVFNANDVFSFMVSSKDKNWQSCQHLIERILSSLKVLSWKTSFIYHKYEKMIVINYPYILPCIEKRNAKWASVIGITNNNAQLFINCRVLCSLYEAMLAYAKINSITKANDFFCIKKEFLCNGWNASFFADKNFSQIAVVAKRGECIMVLNLPTKTDDLFQNIVFLQGIMEKTRIFPSRTKKE